MNPQALIDDLDRSLADSGEDIRLVRTVGSTPQSVDCRARVRGMSADKLLPGINQIQSVAVISPTQINAAGWPGASPSAEASVLDRRIPVQGDRAFINGAPKVVHMAKGVYVAGVLVRINIVVLG